MTDPAAEPPRARFGSDRALAYDDTISRAIPGYALLHDVAATVLRSLLPNRARLLVIGAGTGTDIIRMGRDNPGWRFLGVDPSPDMLAVARARVAATGPDLAARVDLREGTLDSLAGEDDAPGDGGGGPFDAALALLVTHFLPDTADPDGKAALLTRAAGMLRPGAPLMLADFQVAEGAILDPAGLERAWVVWQRDQGLEDAAIERGLAHARRAIRPLTQARLATLLADAGFWPPERLFQVLHVQAWLTRRADPT